MIYTHKSAGALLCAMLLLLLSACTTSNDIKDQTTAGVLTQDTRTDLLGTVITLSAYDHAGPTLFEETFAIVEDIDARMSVNRADSEISLINQSGGNSSVTVSKDIRDLISWSTEFSELSNGAFDITVGSVMELWKSGGTFSVLPDSKNIEANLPLINYREILITDESVLLNNQGMKLDLGAIAKGYACDKALEYLKAQGVKSALLDFGGNIYAHGSKADGTPWKIGIQTPLIEDSGVVCSIEVTDATVVTSGGYERYFEKDGVTYHHLLDPHTGYPADNELLSVTIIDTSSAHADALSTACFVLGLDDGYAFLEAQPKSEGIFITKDNAIYLTAGLRGKVVLIDSRFHIAEYSSGQ